MWVLALAGVGFSEGSVLNQLKRSKWSVQEVRACSIDEHIYLQLSNLMGK